MRQAGSEMAEQQIEDVEQFAVEAAFLRFCFRSFAVAVEGTRRPAHGTQYGAAPLSGDRAVRLRCSFSHACGTWALCITESYGG